MTAYVTANRTLPRSLDVQISLSRAQAELRTDLTRLCVACTNLGLLPNASRIRYYSDFTALTDDFAPGTEPYFAGAAFFAQSPRPTTMAIGEVFTEAQPAILASPALTAAQIAAIAAISNGSMVITWATGGNAEDITLTGLNFNGVTTLEQIETVINDVIGSADIDILCAVKTLPGGSKLLTIETISTGDGITISAATEAGSGVYAGDLLGLSTAGSVTICAGYTPTGIAGELQNIANAATRSGKFIYGWCLGASQRVAETQEAAAAWALPQTYAVMSLVTAAAGAKDPNVTTDIGTVIYGIGNKRVELRYGTNPQEYPDVSMMAYMLSVNYRLKDSTVTSKFKLLEGITPEDIEETEWTVLQSKGYNTYTLIGNTSRVNREGNMAEAGWWYDSVVNLDNFKEDLSVAVYNVFLRNKKIPYKRDGQILLADPCIDVGRLYTYNDTFSPRDVADDTLKSGYRTERAVTVTPTPIYLMTVSDRVGRIGPPMSMVCNETGAIHSIAINVEVVD